MVEVTAGATPPCVGTKPQSPPLRSSRLDQTACSPRAVVPALGQEMARSMCHFQVRRRSKPHRGFGKKAPAHPFPTHLLSHLRGSPFRESALGFGPRARTSKLCRSAKNRRPAKADLRFLVEVTGLEPTTSWSLTKRATKLRYTSMKSTSLLYRLFAVCQVFFSAFGQNFFFTVFFFDCVCGEHASAHTFFRGVIQWTGGMSCGSVL